MSRFGGDDYDEDFPNQGYFWQHNVDRSFNSKGGTAALRKLAEALDAMPVKELAHGAWRLRDTGQVCALGALAVHCGQVPELMGEYEDDPYGIAKATSKVSGLPWGALWVIEYENDEGFMGSHSQWDESTADRWTRIREWTRAELEKRDAAH